MIEKAKFAMITLDKKEKTDIVYITNTLSFTYQYFFLNDFE